LHEDQGLLSDGGRQDARLEPKYIQNDHLKSQLLNLTSTHVKYLKQSPEKQHHAAKHVSLDRPAAATETDGNPVDIALPCLGA
jgi:hypothetical protein